MPPKVAGAVTDGENLRHGKALLSAANSDGRPTEAERRWVIGRREQLRLAFPEGYGSS
jgi:hypothetical protein